MHLTIQTIVSTFVLLSICAYANLMNLITVVNRAPGITHEADWCAGFTDEGCNQRCQLAGFGSYQCNPRYVDLFDYYEQATICDSD